MSIVVTGASGFVGAALVKRLAEAGKSVRPIVRSVDDRARRLLPVAPLAVGDFASVQDWSTVCEDAQVVVHAAARVHVMNEASGDPLKEYRAVNVAATLRLARHAAQSGVRRFVFLSSAKVNGEETLPGQPFSAYDTPQPADPYAVSKMEAEQGLQELAAATRMQVVIVRPPLVYGPGVKANFAAIMKLVKRGLPLPLGGITHNRRSFVALDNLVDFVGTCMDHPAAANQTFMVSDGDDISTAELIRRMAAAMNRPALLLPVPAGWLEFLLGLLGRADIARRLMGSLQVDIAKNQELLGWRPTITMEEGLGRIARP